MVDLNTPIPDPSTAINLRPTLPPILVADDDEDDLFFTVRLIKRTGTENPVMTFDDGAGVVDYLSRAWLSQPNEPHLRPRLLFLDLKMRGLGGFAFLEWLQSRRELAALSVVVLSGSDEPQDVERAKRLGAKRYLAKHPSVATFTTIVQSVHAPGPARTAAQPGVEFFSAGVTEWNDAAGALRQRRRD
jgi:CheY-like chemotaxis protein